MDSDHSTESTASVAAPDQAAPVPEARRGRVSSARGIVFVVLCGILGYVAFALFPLLAGPESSPGRVTEVAVQPTPPAPVPSTPSPTPTEAGSIPAPAGPVAAPPQRLVYPAADIDVPVHPLDPSSTDVATQTIVPPATMDGYWLTPFGMPGAGSVNTTYVVGHSWEDREAPFNRLSTKAAVGDRFTVSTTSGDVAYQVDAITTYVKSGLKDSPVWEVVPHRIVLISCYTGDLWGTNVVVVATPVTGP